MYFRYSRLPKAWLAKYLKSAVLPYPSTSNMINALKHCSGLHGGTFTILINRCEGY